MRHSRRADTDQEEWSQSRARKWDPPLSRKGFHEFSNVLPKILDGIGMSFDLYTSPFKRCLDTAEIIRKQAGLSIDQLVIDLSLSELYDYAKLVRTINCPDVMNNGHYRPMEEWFTSSKLDAAENDIKNNQSRLSPPAPLRCFLRDQMGLGGETLNIIGEFPRYEKYISHPFQILPRFCESFEHISAKGRDAIIVTHMIGVNSMINNLFGYRTFYVPQGNYIAVQRSRESPDSAWGPWNLMKKGFIVFQNQ